MLIVIGSVATVIVLVFAVNLIGALMSYSDNVISHPSTADKSVTPHALITETLGWARDTAKTAGGTWNNGNGQAFDPNDTAGYDTNGCGGNAARYEVLLKSTGSSDPVAAAKRMMAHWKKLGYPARYVGSTDPTNGGYTEIAADLANGAGISYSTSANGDGIIAYGQCSAALANRDPSK